MKNSRIRQAQPILVPFPLFLQCPLTESLEKATFYPSCPKKVVGNRRGQTRGYLYQAYLLSASNNELEENNFTGLMNLKFLQLSQFFSQICQFVFERLSEYVGNENQETFFTPAERAYLLEICLESVQYNRVS